MPYEIQPTYISPENYAGYNCEELIKEKKRKFPTYMQLYADIEKEIYDNEIMLNYLGFSIFPPRTPRSLKNNDKYDELAYLKGQLYAIQDKSDELNCGLIVVLPPRKN